MAEYKNIIHNEVKISGEAELEKMRRKLAESRAEAEELQWILDKTRESLQESETKLAEIEKKYENLSKGSGYKDMETEVANFKAMAEKQVGELKAFLQVNHLNDGKGINDAKFQNFYNAIRAGAMTASDAIVQVKNDMVSVERESADGIIDTSAIQQTLAVLNNMENTLGTVLEKVSLLSSGEISASSGSSGLGNIAQVMDRVDQAAQGMNEEVRTSYESITTMLRAMNDYASLDEAKLVSISQAFRNIADIGHGRFGTKSIENIVHLAKQLQAIGSSGGNFRFDFTTFNGLKVSKSSISNLATYLPLIAKANAEKLEALSHIDLSNFNNLKVSKGAIENINGLVAALRELKEITKQVAAQEKAEERKRKPKSIDETQVTRLRAQARKMLDANGGLSKTDEYKNLEDVYNKFTTAIKLTASESLSLEEALTRVGLSGETAAKTARDAMNALQNEITSAGAGAKTVNMVTPGTDEYIKDTQRITTLLKAATDAQNKFTAAKNGKSKGSYESLDVYIRELNTLQTKLDRAEITQEEFNSAIAKLSANINGAIGGIKSAGEATLSFGQRMKKVFSRFANWFGVSRIFMGIVQVMRRMIDNVKAIDVAMTELRKVTNETEEVYDNFLINASSRAKKLGASLADVVSASADFARLGYGLLDAEKLADAALVYKNVGDGISDISEASESIIATMQAFNGEIPAQDVMLIVDKFNEVGNNFAISSKGVGDALLRSAAAMNAAGNSLDQTIALAAAANTIVQNPETVGTTLKTISMYLRAAKTEAEEAGESTDGMANSVSELRDELLSLTGNKVDIQIDNDTFKDTYQILGELSRVWEDLSDTTQANITELIGGKRNANVVSALLENFSVAEAAMEKSAQAAGSALIENEKYLDSIAGRISVFQAAFETLSSSLIDSGWVKAFVDAGTGLANMLTSMEKIYTMWPLLINSAMGYLIVKQAIAEMNHRNKVDAIVGGLKSEKEATDVLSVSVANLTFRERELLKDRLRNMMLADDNSRKIAEQAAATWGLNLSETTLTATNKGLAASFKSVTASIPIWGWIAAGISLVIDGILIATSCMDAFGKTTDESLESLNQELEQTLSETERIASEFRELEKSSKEDIFPRFVELAAGVNKLGEKVDLTDKEYEEFLSLNNQIAEMFPDIVRGYDDNGNAILSLSYDVGTLSESLEHLLEIHRQQALQQIADDMDRALVNIQQTVDFYEKKINDLKNQSANIGSKPDSSLASYTPNGIGMTGKTRLSLMRGQVDSLQREQQMLSDSIVATWSGLNTSATAWVQTSTRYAGMSDKLREIAVLITSGLDFSELGGLETAESVRTFIDQQILIPLAQMPQSVQSNLSKSLKAFESGEITEDELVSTFTGAFRSVFFNMLPQQVNRFTELFISSLSNMGIEGESFEEVLSGLISEWYKAETSTDRITKSVKSLSKALEGLESHSGGFDALDEIYADIVDGKDFDWSSIFNNEDFSSAFGNLDSYESFRETISNSTSDISGCQVAFDQLATEYVRSIGILDELTDKTQESIKAFLEQKGIAIDAAAIDELVAYNKEKSRLASAGWTEQTWEQIKAEQAEQIAGSMSAKVLGELALQKRLLDENKIDSVDEVQEIINIAEAAKTSTKYLENLAKAEKLALSIEREKEKVNSIAEGTRGREAFIAQSEEYVAMLQTQINNLVSGVEFQPISIDEIIAYNGGSSTQSALEKASKNVKTWFEKEYDYRQHLMEMDQQNTETYINWLESAYKRAYKEGIISLDDYYKYEEEVYQGRKELFEDFLSDVEHDISMREDAEGESKNVINLYSTLIAAVEAEIKKARSRGLKDSDDYIQELQDKLKGYLDSIKDIQDEALDGAKSAVDELVDYRLDMIKQDIENEKDALDKKLDYLKEFYDKQKEMLQDQHDEEKYLEEQSEKRKSVSDLKEELDRLKYDDSFWAQKRKLELQEEITTAEKELKDFEDDHSLDMALDALDNAYEAQEKQLQAEMEALDEKLNDPNALFNQALSDIRATAKDQLYYSMLMYNRQYGDGKDSTVNDLWESAYGALSEYQRVFGKLYENITIKNATNYKPSTPTVSTSASTTTQSQSTSSTSSQTAGKATPSLPANGATVTVKKTATNFSAKSQNLRMASFVPGGTYTVYGRDGTQILIGRNGVYTGWVNLDDLVGYGYASGTRYATPGLHGIDEEGTETIFESADGSKFRMFTGGEKVLNAKASDFLYEFANSGGDILTKLLDGSLGRSLFDKIRPVAITNEVSMGDIIIEGNADRKTVSEIRRAQRENLSDLLKNFNRLNK